MLDLFGLPARSFPTDRSLKKAIKTVEDAQAASKRGLEFTEVMTGFIHIGGDIDDFEIASNAGKSSAEAARFFLSVHAWDTDTCQYSKPHRTLSKADKIQLSLGTTTLRC